MKPDTLLYMNHTNTMYLYFLYFILSISVSHIDHVHLREQNKNIEHIVITLQQAETSTTTIILVLHTSSV